MNLDPAAIRPEVIALVPEALCRRHRVLPVDRIENSLMLAMRHPPRPFENDFGPRPTWPSSKSI